MFPNCSNFFRQAEGRCFVKKNMKRTHEFITKEPYDPVWLAELNERNNTPELVEYKLSERTGKLSRRYKKSIDDLWSRWRATCKHNIKLERCKNCCVKVEKKKEIDRTASYDRQERQRKAVLKFKGKQNNEDRFKKRKIELASLNRVFLFLPTQVTI